MRRSTGGRPPPLHGNGMSAQTPDDLKDMEDLAQARHNVLAELGKRIVGQHEVIENLLVALFSKGHCLFVGVPGLAKTLLISTLAEVLDLGFSRIQFTPDLMPSDITGTDVLEEDKTTGRRSLRFLKGPLFAHLVLADEVNRTPPKTQAALLQAMQEYRITAGGNTFELEQPFLVFATQNPIEQEGTYALPEAQLDRFMFLVDVGYPSLEEECRVVQTTTGGAPPPLNKVLTPQRILQLQALVRRVPVPQHVLHYAVALVRATRPTEAGALEFVKAHVAFGAGPRASQFLVLGAKARAALLGRFAASAEDVQAIAKQVLRHRVLMSFSAQTEGFSSVELVERILKHIQP